MKRTEYSFSLQKVNINIGKETLENIKKRIDEAMESYSWIYQNEKEHDVLVSILVHRKFKPKT